MASGQRDGFSELIDRFTEELRLEHQREIDALVRKIGEYESRLGTREQPSPCSEDPPPAGGELDGGPPPEFKSDDPPQRAAGTSSRPTVSHAISIRSAYSNNILSSFVAETVTRRRFADIGLIGHIETLVSSAFFETAIAVLIAMNGVVGALEAHHTSVAVAAEMGYPRVGTTLEIMEGRAARDAFDALGWIFGCLFAAELILRMVAQRTEFPRDPWNWMDTVVVAFFVGEQSGKMFINPQILRLARFGKIVRLLRLARNIRGLDSLFLMTSSLRHSVGILFWSSCLLFLIIVFNALMLNGLLTEFYFTDRRVPESERLEIYRYFGTIASSLFSMFELTLANWPPISRALYENVTDWFIPVCVLHKLTIGFACIGVINGVFIQETFKVSQQDDEVILRQANQARRQYREKMRLLVEQADRSGTGSICKEDFREIFKNPKLGSWLSALQIDTHDVDSVFNLMDDGNGFLTANELIRGVARLKGPARNIDLNLLLYEHRLLQDRFNAYIEARTDGSAHLGRSESF